MIVEQVSPQDQERMKQVTELLAKRESLRRAAAESATKWAEAERQAKQRERELRDELYHAEQKLVAAASSRLTESAEFSRQHAEVDARLRKLAPPEINEFIREMLHAADNVRRWVRPVGEVPPRIAAINELVAKAEAMKLEPLTRAEVLERLAAMRTEISFVPEE